jgi:hypothetical protein
MDGLAWYPVYRFGIVDGLERYLVYELGWWIDWKGVRSTVGYGECLA